MEFEVAVKALALMLRHQGKDNPIKASTIKDLTGIDDRMYSVIADLCIRHGIPICSGAGGYFTAKSKEEFDQHLEKEEGRAMALLGKVSDGRKRFIDMKQVTLFDQEGA